MASDTNSVSDEIKNEIKKVWKNKTGLERVKYFVYYYKVQFIVAVLAVVFIVSMAIDIANRKECVFQAMIINGEFEDRYDYDTFWTGFEDRLEYDKEKEEIKMDSSIHVNLEEQDQTSQMLVQKVFLNVSTQDLDVIVCDESFMRLTRAQHCLYDFRDLLSEEQMAKYEDKLVWYDNPVEEVGEDASYVGEVEALCIDVSDCKKIKEGNMFPYTDGKAYLMIFGNSTHADKALDFLEYLDE